MQQWRDAAGGEKDVRRKAAESLVAVLIDLAGDVQRVDAAAPEAAAALDAVGALAKELSTEAGTTKVVEVLTAGNMDAAERKSPAHRDLVGDREGDRQGWRFLRHRNAAWRQGQTRRSRPLFG
jgi:hypothetical protein